MDLNDKPFVTCDIGEFRTNCNPTLDSVLLGKCIAGIEFMPKGRGLSSMVAYVLPHDLIQEIGRELKCLDEIRAKLSSAPIEPQS